LHPSEEKSIKVFRMRGKCIHTEKMFLLRSIFDVSGPSASEFLIFFVAFDSFIFIPFFSVPCTRTHIQRARWERKKKFTSRHERIGWLVTFEENENFTWTSPKKKRQTQLTDYHSPPWFHSNPSHLGNPILVFHYNMHNIDTISYDACSSDHFDHFLSLYSIKILFFRFFFWFFSLMSRCCGSRAAPEHFCTLTRSHTHTHTRIFQQKNGRAEN
jgi:hypothetical protein